MSETVGSILIVAVPAVLGSSVLSSLITTYVTQSGERRRTRAEVRNATRAVEKAAIGGTTTPNQMRELIDEFIQLAMLARLPMPLADLYVASSSKVWAIVHPYADRDIVPDDVKESVFKVMAETFSLLALATWRPRLSKFKVWRRTRRYRRILVGAAPDLDRQYFESRSRRKTWERDMLKRERRDRRTRRGTNYLDQVKGAVPSAPPDVPARPAAQIQGEGGLFLA
jgi:hypothetical protein